MGAACRGLSPRLPWGVGPALSTSALIPILEGCMSSHATAEDRERAGGWNAAAARLGGIGGSTSLSGPATNSSSTSGLFTDGLVEFVPVEVAPGPVAAAVMRGALDSGLTAAGAR